jgi:hypothetical protein
LSANQPPGTSTNTKFNRDKPREPAFSMRAAVQRRGQCAAGQF